MVELKASENRKSMQCYQVGPDAPKRTLVVFSDVFGIDSGNHKVVCDVLQEKLGVDTAVWMPDLFRGKAIMGAWGLGHFITDTFGLPSILWACFTNMKEANLEADLKEVVAPALQTDKVACLGFCYGGWVSGRAVALEGFPAKAAVGIHPSWKIETIFSKKEEDLAAKVNKTPFLFLAASNDDLKVGTPVVEALAKGRGVEQDKVSIEFPEMKHGWVPRGDSSDEKVKADQEKATTLAVDFVKEHVKV